MFILPKKKTEPQETIVTHEQEYEIILDYLKQCAEGYKNQPTITAERMIEMEIELLTRRRSLDR